MVSAFDGRINDEEQQQLKDPTAGGGGGGGGGGKPPRPSIIAMTSDLPADKGGTRKDDVEKANEADDLDGVYGDSRPRTPIVTGPIIELRGREVIFAIGVFFLFAIVVGLIVVLASHKVTADTDTDTATKSTVNGTANTTDRDGGATDAALTCETQKSAAETNRSGDTDDKKDGSNATGSQCSGGDFSADWVLTAANLIQNMNRSADPCEDFWEYSCGGWLDRVEIPQGVESVGVDSFLDARIRRDIRTILEGEVKRNSPTSAERKFKDLYKTCMDVDAIENLGSRPILDIVDQFGGWAFLPDWNLAEKSGRWSILKVLSEVHFTYDVEAFFSLAVGKDDKNSSINILQFDQGGLGLPNRNDYFKSNGNSSLVVAYKQYMATIARLFHATDEMANSFVESAFEMEKELAKLHTSEHSEERRDSESMYNPLNVTRLQQISPRINWRRFLTDAFPSVTDSTLVLVTSEQYMSNISSLISNANESDVSNYLLWRLMTEFASALLSKSFRDAHHEFRRAMREAPADSGRVVSRHSYCQKVVIEWFGHGVSAEYVRMNDFDGTDKDILEMIANIKAIFRDTIQQSDWMDDDTRANALAKLDSMQERVGFPHFILNNAELDDYYDGFNVEAGKSFFSNIVGGLTHQRRKRSDALELNDQTEDWSMNPLEVNAFYSMTENIVGFTAGLLQKPFYDKKAPNFVNYASLGSTIAHEISHAFDESGALYDSEGNLKEWWTNETMAQFTTRTRCVEEYYDGLTVNGIQVNGELTLNENLADIGGLKHAYKAYKTWETSHASEITLPGLNLTNDEVFFVAFAQNWCKSRRKESVEKFMSRNIHAIEEIRVKGTISQTEDFGTTFRCSPQSPMNPDMKCKVW